MGSKFRPGLPAILSGLIKALCEVSMIDDLFAISYVPISVSISDKSKRVVAFASLALQG